MRGQLLCHSSIVTPAIIRILMCPFRVQLSILRNHLWCNLLLSSHCSALLTTLDLSNDNQP